MKKTIIIAAILGMAGGAYGVTPPGQPGVAETKAADAKPENTRIKAAIAGLLKINLPGTAVRVISVEVGPYPDGVSFPFSAKTEETGPSGAARRFIVYGIYDSVTDTIISMGKTPDTSARAASLKGRPVFLDGAPAAGIFTALESAGAYADCGSGSCQITAADILARMRYQGMYPDGKPRYDCSFNRHASFYLLKDGPAEQIFDALQNPAAGLEPDCGAGTCAITAKALVCRKNYDSGSASCAITPD